MSKAWISVLAAALAALAAPTAAAGTPEDPEVVDATLDAGAANGHMDLEKAWIEQTDPEQIRMHIVVHALPPTHVGLVYALAFDAGDDTWVGALVHVDEPEPFFSMGRLDRDALKESDLRDVAGSYTPGAPGEIAIHVPLARIDRNATQLANLTLYALDIKAGIAGGPYLLLDQAEGERPFDLMPRATDPREEALAAPAETQARDEPPEPTQSVAPAANEGARETPAPAAPVAALLAVLVAHASSRRRA